MTANPMLTPTMVPMCTADEDEDRDRGTLVELLECEVIEEGADDGAMVGLVVELVVLVPVRQEVLDPARTEKGNDSTNCAAAGIAAKMRYDPGGTLTGLQTND